MTQQQIKELFGVPPSTLKDWKADPKHPRHALALYLSALKYEEAKSEIEKLKNAIDNIADNRL